MQPHAPAAGEAVDRVGEFGGFETQAEDQRLRAGWCVVRAGVLQRHVGVGHAVVVVGGLGGGDLLLRGEQGGVAVDHKVGGTLPGFGHVLRHLAHAPLGGDAVFAEVFVQAAVEEGKQAGFARTVATHQTNLLTRVEGDRGAVQQNFGAAAQRDVF